MWSVLTPMALAATVEATAEDIAWARTPVYLFPRSEIRAAPPRSVCTVRLRATAAGRIVDAKPVDCPEPYFEMLFEALPAARITPFAVGGKRSAAVWIEPFRFDNPIAMVPLIGEAPADFVELARDQVHWQTTPHVEMPASVRAAGGEAECKVRLFVDPAGRLVGYQPQTCADDLLFDVRAGLAGSTFDPVTVDGRAVGMTFVQTFVFRSR